MQRDKGPVFQQTYLSEEFSYFLKILPALPKGKIT